MVFLVPSQFDSFLPPPPDPGQRAAEEAPTRPWNGDLVVAGLRPSDRTLSERVHVSAIETDGEKVESWPNEFALTILYTDSERDIRREMSHWVLQTGQPTVNFMPTRMRGSNQHDTNIALFRSLSKVLMENHTVAIAPWRTGELVYQGSGIIIFPAPNSSAYLIGAVFHSTDFPDFIRSALSPTVAIPAAPGMSVSGSYQQHSSPYSAHVPQSHYRNQPQSSSPHHSGPSSPVEHPSSAYRYIVPGPMPARGSGQYPGQSSSSSGANSGGHYGAGYPPTNP